MDKGNLDKSDKGKDLPVIDYDWDSYSSEIDTKINEIDDNDDFLNDINESLAKQVSNELKDSEDNNIKEDKEKKRMTKGVKIFAVVFSSIMLMLLLLLFTPPGKKLLFTIAGNYIYGSMDIVKDPVDIEVDDNVDGEKVTKPVKVNEHIVNILLLGVEEIGGASNTDVMIVATMDTKNKTLKLTSLMRDLYVEIPGYSNNKLNSAYAKGNIELLYQTIKTNFNLDLDGYVLVNFSTFEKIVDIIGGVEVTLTAKEANYLNTTNYISNPAYRNVHEGTQVMNGNQALGYCRIRKVSTGTENNDFGRTQRHRAVLNAIFEKLKSKNIVDLGITMNKILNNVTLKTDITQSEFNQYLEEAASLNVKNLEQYRIPSDGNYHNERVQLGRYKQDVLVPNDWEATRKELHDFIYGVEETVDYSNTTATVAPVQ